MKTFTCDICGKTSNNEHDVNTLYEGYRKHAHDVCMPCAETLKKRVIEIKERQKDEVKREINDYILQLQVRTKGTKGWYSKEAVKTS